MYFKKSSNKDKKQEKDEVQNKYASFIIYREQIKKPEQVISPPYRFDGEINSQPIGLNQFLMNVNALESEPNSNHEIGREWMNSQHKYTQSYANILHNHPFLNQSVGSNPARNSWWMPKSNIESLPAANKDLNKMKHRELQYYEGSSDQSLKCVSDMSNDKSSQEIWQPKNQKQTRSPKPSNLRYPILHLLLTNNYNRI